MTDQIRDGYLSADETVAEQEFFDLQALYADQKKIKREVKKALKDLNTMPNLPHNIDHWMESIPDLNRKKSFTMGDFSKMFKMTKKYQELLDKQEVNAARIKVAQIEDVLGKIKNLIGE